MPSQVTRNALDDPQNSNSAHNFIEYFGPTQESRSLKMAEIWLIL